MNQYLRVLSFLILVPAVAAAPSEVEGQGEVVEIVMPDGVRLTGTLFLPDSEEPVPTILVRTPYGRGQHHAEGEVWSAHGYAVLLQDARGKFDSEGEFLPFIHEVDDGLATLDWIRAQPWSNGKVGMWGSSYLAYCALALGSAGHPSLDSLFVISGWLSRDKMTSFAGANHIMLSIPWILHEESQTHRNLQDYEVEDLFEYLPLFDVFESIGIQSRIWTEDYALDVLDQYGAADIDIPMFHLTGWHDFVYEAALDNYAAASENGELHRLIIGPWFHDQFYTTYTEVGDDDFGPASALGRDRIHELVVEWFDLTLKGIPTPAETRAPVEAFVMGANEWREFESWPPASMKPQRWYLGSTEGANSLRGDGRLTREVPAQSGTDRFLFDPMNPVPSLGGASMHFFLHLLGVKDQREIEEREDVLVYTSEPLSEDLTLAGPIEVVVHASTEGPDTDFTAKLVEVRPDGYARIIEEGIVRASYRPGGKERQLLEPGRVYPFRIDLGATAISLPAGSRIRVEVSSSSFPKYDRNPNTGQDALLAEVLKPVTQTVHHGRRHPSHIVLPVLPSKEKP